MHWAMDTPQIIANADRWVQGAGVGGPAVDELSFRPTHRLLQIGLQYIWFIKNKMAQAKMPNSRLQNIRSQTNG